jgi:hypothetical protein
LCDFLDPRGCADYSSRRWFCRTDVAAQQRGAATSFPMQDGREVFVVGSDRRSGSGARANKGEVFAAEGWSVSPKVASAHQARAMGDL